MNTLCPRCDDPGTEKVSDSPVPGKWEVFRCRRCNYVWRSTEDVSAVHKYDQALVDRVVPFWPQIEKRSETGGPK